MAFKTVGLAAETIPAERIVRFVSGDTTVELADDATAAYCGVSVYAVSTGDPVFVYDDGQIGVPITADASYADGVPLMATTNGVATTAAALTGSGTRYLIGNARRALSATRVDCNVQRAVSFKNS
jgi:hypothetical protein